jgi:hypothetical protein
VAPWSLAAIPLAIAPGLLFYYDVTPKVVLLYCAAAVTLPFADVRRLLASTAGRWFCAILAAMLVSLLVSTRTDLSVFGSTWRRFGLITQAAVLLFAFVVAADLTGGAERLRAYLRASTVATVLVACYAIAQYLGWDPWIDPASYHIGSGIWTSVRPPGTLGYVTYLANYLVFGVFQGLVLYRVERNWVGLAAVVLGSTAVALSGTRAGLVALIVGALVLWGMERRRFTTRTMWIAGSVAAVLVLFYVSPAGQQLRGRMRWFREDPAGGSRLYLWRDSTRLVARHWLKGAGLENFSVMFPQVQSRELSRAFPEFYHESAHNMFLDVGTAQGLPGVLILAAAVVFGLWIGRRSPVLVAGFVAVVVCHQFSVFTVPTALTFWVSLAMLLPAGGAGRPDRRMLWLLPVSLVLVIAAVRLTIGDWHLVRMREAANGSRFEAANAEYVAAGRWGMHADLWYSRKLLTSGQQPAQALVSGLSATVTADDPYNAWMNLGLIYAKLNDVGSTERCIRQAIAASPNWYKPHLVLAQLLLATNRGDAGRKELERAKDLDPGL